MLHKGYLQVIGRHKQLFPKLDQRGNLALMWSRFVSFRLWNACEGSALVEASLVVPVLLVLFLGLFEFSRYFQQQQLVAVGVRDAARYLAAASVTPCNNSTIVSNAKNLATTGSISGGSARVTSWSSSAVTVSCSQISNSSGSYYCPLTPGYCYVVTVSTSFTEASLGLFQALGMTAPTISVSHSERTTGGSAL
ncbi:TadE/TadG family type IV pilus assembly protein [Methylobacterium nodulans]|uniref:TadE family protein n=1 Tax=Methylobacterium nodulans (strain LMG 21967 / CNCM I-2342 / ORS 2060) TaxID=460265 RepID=B8IDZ1_METNO|nr:TadE/TadG family type IV pilus assembly protein [Methylobacterium nodulans]ACL57537.1 TadE family protein [Methylobacterium nodulans ORS 2060]